MLGILLLTARNVEEGLTITMVVVVLLAVMLIILLLTLKRVRPPFVLEDELKSSAEYLNESDLEYLVGKEGTASTDLKPSGKCNVEGVELDVRAESTYIKKGSRVQISRIHENTIMIRQL